MENYSLSDLSAVTGGGGFGNNSAWLIILFVLIFGMGGFGWNNRTGELGQYATAASQQDILFTQKFDAVGQKLNAIGDGICSSTYALNNAITGEGRALQGQLAESNCAIQRNTDALRFDMANYNANVVAAIGADGEKTRALIQQNKVEALQQKINSLELNQAMCGVVRYPNAWTYNAGASPFCGCGCNNI